MIKIHTQIKSFKDLQRSRKKIKNANKLAKENLDLLDKLALFITNKVGTMGFFLTIFTWTAVWLGWNSFGPPTSRFDPYPGFVLWLFISNMIQIFLMPLLMIGQNLQSVHSEARANATYEVNVQAEEEVNILLQHLENQNVMIEEILKRLDDLDKK
jgi:uncharacterized membrane protein